MKKKRILWFALTVFLLLSVVAMGYPAKTSQVTATTWTFQGNVYAGDVGDESHPLLGVTVSVYAANSPYPDPGTFIRSTTTDGEGWYGLPVYDDDGAWEYYHICETDPVGYTSVGATTVGGVIRTANWIEYVIPLEGKTLVENKFWDRHTMPDLVVTEIQCDWDNDRIGYMLQNTGNDVTPAGHYTTLAYCPGGDLCYASYDRVDVALNPEESYQGWFDVLPCGVELYVCADTHDLSEYDNLIEESDEENNCQEWMCECPPLEKPDLVITDIWSEGSTIYYQIRNIGDAAAPAGHHTALLVDEDYVVSDLVDVDLQPGERHTGCFDYVWECSPLDDNIVAWADYDDGIAEKDETNNRREEGWKCDTTPPQIISGPTVLEVTQNSATVFWETNEDSDSVVKYGKTAIIYASEEADSTLVREHSMTLTGLEPSATYGFAVQSTDASGNTVQSQDKTFETLPLPDDIDPIVSIIDPGMCQGIVTISAEASDNTEVEKVEFYLDGELVFTDYSPPYELPMDTTRVENGEHNLKSKVFDLFGRVSEDEQVIGVLNVKDVAAPTVTITSPSEHATVSGNINVAATVSDDTGLLSAYFYVDGVYMEFLPFSDYPTSQTVQLRWDTSLVENGSHRLGFIVYDKDLKSGLDTVDVNVSNVPPPPQPKLVITKHEVVRNQNFFVVMLTVTNVGGGQARNIVIRDRLVSFQPISRGSTAADYTCEFDLQGLAGSDCIINGTWDISAGGSQNYNYWAVPVLIYPDPRTPSIGDSVKLSYEGPDGTKHSDEVKIPVWQTTAGDTIPQAHLKATQSANYLIVTSTARLFSALAWALIFGADIGPALKDTNALLSTMAELAELKQGVLGYMNFYDSDQLKELIRPGREWAQKLHPDFSKQLGGYLLIVGETEIVPSWDIPQPQPPGKDPIGPIHHSDQPYSDTFGNDDRPELIVGRIIGNTPAKLAKAIQTSIRIDEGWSGYGFDRSHALVVTGGCGGENAWQDDADDKVTILDNQFSVDKALCLDYFSISSFYSGFAENDFFAVGNVLGDAKAEILIADDSSGTVSIFNGTGNKIGSFQSGCTWTNGFAVGDVLGDGKAEILVDDGYWHVINIFNGAGSKIGSFDRGLFGGFCLAVGDVLGDGKAEILTNGLSAINIFDAAGNKKASFSTWFYEDFGFAVGNVTADTKAQILVADDVSGVVSVYDAAGNKKGSFNGGFAAGGGFALGNVYPDSKAEVLIADKTGKIHVYYYWVDPEGKKASEFRKALFYQGGFSSKDGFALGDVLGDGYCEVLVASDVSGVVQLSEPQCTARLLSVFKSKAPDKDVIFYTGHGSPYEWCSVIDAQAKGAFPVDFGNTNPFIFAATCSAGNYDPDGDYSIGEAFFDSGASVYIGATIPSGDGPQSKKFFENWVNTPKSIGQAFAETEKYVITSIKDYYWVREYNLYGDPTVGGTASASEASAPSEMASEEEAPSSLEVVVPDYQVTTIDGVDHVEIPGGMLLSVEGKPQVPLYSISLDYPNGYEIQDVSLTQKTGLTTTTGLNIPEASLIVRTKGAEGQDSQELATSSWYPENDYQWSTFKNPDGTTTLVIVMYPFYYNPLTTDVRFYKKYSFDISYAVSPVAITSLTTDKDEYVQGEPIMVDIGLNNLGEPKDVIVNALVKEYGSGEIVDGLLLETLRGPGGEASFSSQWDSAGFEPGCYYLEATLRKTDGNLLDRKTQMFQLGMSSGEITSFTVAPTYFDIGDSIDMSLVFSNKGTVNLSGTAVIRVQDEAGETIQEFSHDVADLAPGNSISFDDTWSTSGSEEGCYIIIGYVSYNSETTAPAIAVVSTNHPPVAEAGPNQVVERSDVAGAEVTLDGSASFDPDGDPLTYSWSWAGGGLATGVSPTVVMPMGITVVTLEVSDGAFTDTDTVSITVQDTTPPIAAVEFPTANLAVQDGITLKASASDLSGVDAVYFYVREPDGAQGDVISPEFEDLPATLNDGAGKWEYNFSTLKLPDGNYLILAKAVDTCNNEGWSTAIPFSIHNWAVIQLLPTTQNNKAGRTMPIKFALRVAASVDPAQPFVWNDELTIKIFATGNPGVILQTSTFGSGSRDYRIQNDTLYITNFQTLKVPMQYTVQIWRTSKNWLVGSFTFKTVK